MPSATEKLAQRQRQVQSRLCIGLDPDERLLPAVLRRGEPQPWKRFLREITAATAPFACAYKLNLVFYEQFGFDGWRLLEDTLATLPAESTVILDGKYGDVPHTAELAARTVFERLGVDAVTVNPLLGADSVAPFLSYPDRLIFVLARTSNAGAQDFLALRCEGGLPLYIHVITSSLHWPRRAELGFVVGATAPEDFAAVRTLAPYTWLLVPGVGTQGGDISTILAINGEAPLLVNVGRSILYASSDSNFAEAAAHAAAAFARSVSLPLGGM
ncbi:MAG: orotidine-5'-phosphate decarboxylase [Candidatus Kapabacteria bacterium]|nr:orotidine-5'-phosphate decarboxylase [Candidatus Kapabacteria bacterium]MCS7169716.1 orotidine-5'-phosphate decarboxylase [Candidatus Kapabacteria bacterium]MDW7996670.1 orotidine-5'-phosphate decarboxylase [Bacteroidota bacterium]MDW8225526.1 orotidine-5'-phosphate decarboxylase [Bacteroidota bacterium]